MVSVVTSATATLVARGLPDDCADAIDPLNSQQIATNRNKPSRDTAKARLARGTAALTDKTARVTQIVSKHVNNAGNGMGTHKQAFAMW